MPPKIEEIDIINIDDEFSMVPKTINDEPEEEEEEVDDEPEEEVDDDDEPEEEVDNEPEEEVDDDDEPEEEVDDDDDDDDEPEEDDDDEKQEFELGGAVGSEDEDEEEDEDDEDEAKKIKNINVEELIQTNYPEYVSHNFEEIEARSKVFRNKYGDIVDEFHKTLPYVTRFEKARILGLRAKQLNSKPTLARVDVDMGIIDGYKIAVEEYKQKKIPFIIKRPLPNGTCQYWKFADLEQI